MKMIEIVFFDLVNSLFKSRSITLFMERKRFFMLMLYFA